MQCSTPQHTVTYYRALWWAALKIMSNFWSMPAHLNERSVLTQSTSMCSIIQDIVHALTQRTKADQRNWTFIAMCFVNSAAVNLRCWKKKIVFIFDKLLFYIWLFYFISTPDFYHSSFSVSSFLTVFIYFIYIFFSSVHGTNHSVKCAALKSNSLVVKKKFSN